MPDPLTFCWISKGTQVSAKHFTPGSYSLPCQMTALCCSSIALIRLKAADMPQAAADTK